MQEFIEAALEYIPHYYDDGMPVPLTISGIFSASPHNPDSYSIASAKPESDNPNGLLFACSRTNLQILPNGRVSICQGLNDDFLGYPPIVTDIPGQKTMPLREILSTGSDYMNLMNKKRSEFMEANPECAECKFLRLCGGGCRVMSFRSYGSIMRKDNERCEFFRGGWFNRVVERLKRIRPQAKLNLPNDIVF